MADASHLNVDFLIVGSCFATTDEKHRGWI
jgi:hypothetical protein